MDKNTVFNVTNRSGSSVVYNIPEDNLRRMFTPGETKRIKFEELEKLSYQQGGPELIANYFLIRDAEILDELNIRPEREYFMTEEEVKELLTFGNLDEFLDALDFAPDGVIQLIKDLSVKLPLNDVEKRAALKKATGFDVDRAVANDRAAKEDAAAIEGVRERRVKVEVDSQAPARRVQQEPKYKVVNIQSE